MRRQRHILAALATIGTLALATAAHAVNPLILGEWNFDGDTAGSPPASTPTHPAYPTHVSSQTGWAITGSDTAGLIVVDSGTVSGIPSSPNAFQQSFSAVGESGAAVMFPAYALNETARSLEWYADIYVDEIGNNDSEGWQFRLMDRTSQIDAGFMRILAFDGAPGGAKWRLYNGLGGPNGTPPYSPDNFNYDQWYKIRIVIDPDSTSSGKVYTYIDGVLQFTETYTGRGLGQTQNMEYWDIRGVQGGNPNRMFIDNLVIAIPEPASAALLAIGGLATLRRRRAS